MRRVSLIVMSVVVLANCASSGAVPRPFPLPSGTVVSTTPRTVPDAEAMTAARHGAADGYSISSTALSLRGAPYRNGGADPAGFDCSGFVKYVFEQNGLSVPRDTRSQFGLGSEVDVSSIEPGDLVFFTTTTPGASHVGISVGGDQFVHAPSSNGVVRVENLSAPYWATRFIGARRVN